MFKEKEFRTLLHYPAPTDRAGDDHKSSGIFCLPGFYSSGDRENSSTQSLGGARRVLSQQKGPKSTNWRTTEKFIFPSRKNNLIVQKDKLSASAHVARVSVP